MTPLIIPLPGNEAMAAGVAAALRAQPGRVALRQFPDGETYLRFADAVADRKIVLVCTLDRPDEKLLPLLVAAATARELGAQSVGLVAPYLAYLRQDYRFQPGEAVTSRHVAKLLSDGFDWLATVDPHLHRYKSLTEIYSIPHRAVSAAPLIAQWIKENMPHAILIGPDSESEQWVAAVAEGANIAFTVLEKIRRGDRDVRIEVKDPAVLADRPAILVDDIISTGHTMIEAARLVTAISGQPPACVAVHGLFADRADQVLAHMGVSVITSNTVRHPSNTLDVAPLLAEAINALTQ